MKIFIQLIALIFTLALTQLCSGDPDVTVMFNPKTGVINAQSIDTPDQPSNNYQPIIDPVTSVDTTLASTKIETKDNTTSAKNEEANVYLNFDNVSLTSVVNYLSERKKINLVPHKDLEAQRVSLSTRKPITLERAWKILLTLLEVNGFSIVNVDNLYRIVSSKDNGVEPLPYYSSQTTSPEDLPTSDLVIRYIYFFKNIKPDIANDILRSMLEGDKSVQPLKDLQAVIIKEKCNNIKAAMKIIQELDTGGLRQAIRIVPLKEADADTVQKLLNQDLIGNADGGDERLRFVSAENQSEGAYFSSATKIISDPSKNSLIILGTPSSIDKICNFIYKYIDVPIGSADSRIHIKQLRYAKAEQLKPILDNIIKPPAGQGNEKSSIVGQFKFFEDVIIKDDTGGGDDNRGAGNRLIVSAGLGDWARLDKFIDMLDKPSPQVAFEVLVVDLETDQEKELSAQLQTSGMLGAGVNRVQFNNMYGLDSSISQENYSANNPTIPAYKFTDIITKLNAGNAGIGAYLTLGKPGTGEGNDVWGIIRSAISNTSAHIVTQPFLITNNFQECSMNIGSTKRVPGPLSTDKGGSSAVQEQVEKTAETSLKLTPQINFDGIVNLKLDMSINEFGASAPEGPPVTKRTINTRVSLAAGEVLVLGGMTKSNQTLTQNATPLLSKIPILGNLFRKSNKTKTESNLYIFIRPSVIKPNFDGAPDEYTQLKLDYSKFQMMKNDNYAQENDPIQRWFFKPEHHSVKERLTDARNGVFRPIDDFTYGKRQPKTVDIKNDPYFASKETVARNKQRRALKSRKKHSV